IMALAAARGQRVVCVTATKGEAGSPDPERWSAQQMAEIRERELSEGLAILGIEEHHWLGYVDGTCHEVALDEGAARVAEIFEAVRRDAVLTSGPDGYTGHDDHRAISAWVTEAHRGWLRRGEHAGLHYATQTPQWEQAYGGPWRGVGAFPPDLPP